MTATESNVTIIVFLIKLINHQKVLKFIHPFIIRIDFDDVKKRQIRLLHQSTKKYINKNHTSNQFRLQNSIIQTATNQMFVDRFIEHLKTFILNICIRYLLLNDIDHVYIFSDEQMTIDELSQKFDLFNDNTESIDYNVRCT